MPASATIAASMASQVPAPEGTGNVIRQQLEAAAAITAETDTIAQLSIVPDDAITGDDQLIEIRLLAASQSVTPDHTAEDFTATAHGYAEGQAVQLGGTAAPTGLTLATMYYIKYVDADTFQLAATVGGTALPFSSNGTAVTVRAFGRATLSYQYPSTGTAVPVEIRDMANGTPDDFTRIRALQIILRPLDTSANASGSIQLTAGDTSDRYAYFAIPLTLAFTTGDEQNWPSWTASLPEGLPYDTAWDLTCRILSDDSNVNLLVLINLLGN